MGCLCCSNGTNREGNQSLENKNNGKIICELCFVEGHCEDVRRMSEVWCG